MPSPSSENPEAFHWRKLPLLLRGFVIFALAAAALMLLAYLWQFGSQGVPPKQDTWGQFGDFMGGILNPLIAGAALIALLYGIQLQRAELASTKAELTNSNELMDQQRQLLELQTFESTFFKLLDHLDSLREAVFGKVISARRDGSSSIATARDTLHAVHSRLLEQFKKANSSDAEHLKEIIEVVQESYQAPLEWVRSFSEGVILILTFVDSSNLPPERRKMYFSFIDFRTSPIEKALLLYWTLGNSREQPNHLLHAHVAGLFSKLGSSHVADVAHLELPRKIYIGELSPLAL